MNEDQACLAFLIFKKNGKLHLCDECVLRLRTQRLYYSGKQQNSIELTSN